MKVLSDLTGNTLELLQPKLLKNSYELRLGDEVLGKMVYPKVFSTDAQINLMDKRWEIKKVSLWKGTVGLHKFGFEQPSAVYTPRLFKPHEIRLYGGEYLYIKMRMFHHRIELMDRSMKPLLQVKGKTGFKKRYLVPLDSKSSTLDENPWLIFMLCYIMMSRERSSHAAAG